MIACPFKCGKAYDHYQKILAPALLSARGRRHADMTVEGAAIRLRKPGPPKFVARVSEATFDGQQALRAGKQVFYVTPVGVFRLTNRGMELSSVMPGIDVRRDILAATPMKVVLPQRGAVPVIARSVVTGDRFTLPRRR